MAYPGHANRAGPRARLRARGRRERRRLLAVLLQPRRGPSLRDPRDARADRRDPNALDPFGGARALSPGVSAERRETAPQPRPRAVDAQPLEAGKRPL